MSVKGFFPLSISFSYAAILAVSVPWFCAGGEQLPAKKPPQFSAWGETAPLKNGRLPLPQGWRDVTEKDPALSPANGTAEKGFLLFSRPRSLLLGPYSIPRVDEIDKSISIFGCPGEYETATFAVHALTECHHVTAEISHLEGPDGQNIPATNCEIRSMNFIHRPVNEILKTYRRVPAFLEKRASVSIPCQNTQPFLVVLKIPEKTPPGLYRGRITVLADGRKSSLPLTLNVLPISLACPEIGIGIIFKVFPLSWKERYGLYPENWKKDMANLKEYGLHTLYYYGYPRITGTPDNLSIDFMDCGGEACSMEEFVTEGLNSGFLRREIPIIWFGAARLGKTAEEISGEAPGTPAYENCYRKIVIALQDEFRKRNWPEFVFNLSDEPSNNAAELKRCKYETALLKKIPGIRGSAMLNGLWWGINDGELIRPDIRIGNYITPKVLKEAARAKSEFWIYNTGIDRYSYGVYLYKVQAKGILQWIYQNPPAGYPPEGDNPYAAFSKNTYLHAYPAPDGPLPTPELESMREGIKDYRYLLTLEQLIRKANGSTDSKIRDEAAKASALLREILDPVPVPIKEMPGYRRNHPEQTLDYYRWQIANEIMKLNETISNSSSALPENQAQKKNESAFEPPSLQTAAVSAQPETEHLSRSEIVNLLRLASFSQNKIFPADDPQKGRKVEIPFFSRPPAINGTLSDPIWMQGARLTDFLLTGSDAQNFLAGLSEKKAIAVPFPVKAKDQTTVRIGYDKENLYLGIHCDSPTVPTSRKTLRDAPLWREDSVEIFLDPGHTGKNYFHIVLNPAGSCYDARKDSDEKGYGDASWNGQYRIAAASGKDGWCVTLAIPFATLGKKMQPGTPWGFNITRNHPEANPKVSTWSYLYGNEFHDPAHFGLLCGK